jgi:hypothetical protein
MLDPGGHESGRNRLFCAGQEEAESSEPAKKKISVFSKGGLACRITGRCGHPVTMMSL